jgi:Na+-driven multidrug efflux pump
MFPFQMGMMGAAAATALSQLGTAGVYGWRIWKRKMLPQPSDKTNGEKNVNIASVVRSIMGANVSMLAKQGSMLIFYTYATALATRLGPAHIAAHQVALSFFWLVTFWLDSGSVSGQVLMSKSQNDIPQALSLTKYMTKYALFQGLTLTLMVAAMGRFLPLVFTQDPTIISLLIQIIPYLAAQQTLVSLCLVLEGLAVGGNQFRYMAGGTAAATVLGMWRLQKATSVVDIWRGAVSIFFVARLLNAVIGVARVHWGMRKTNRRQEGENRQAAAIAAA